MTPEGRSDVRAHLRRERSFGALFTPLLAPNARVDLDAPRSVLILRPKKGIIMRVFASMFVCGSVLAACGGDGGGGTGGESGGKAADTRKITVDSDFRTLVAGALGQYQHETEASCPCKVEDGDFESEKECIERLGHDEEFVDCVVDKLKSQSGDKELRAALHCAMRRYEARAECVEDNGCGLEEVTACYEDIDECPVLDPRALTVVVTECPGGSLLGR